MKYKIEEYPEQNGKWGGYKISAADPEGRQGFLHPTGKDGKGIEIKRDPNKDITPH